MHLLCLRGQRALSQARDFATHHPPTQAPRFNSFVILLNHSAESFFRTPTPQRVAYAASSRAHSVRLRSDVNENAFRSTAGDEIRAGCIWAVLPAHTVDSRFTYSVVKPTVKGRNTTEFRTSAGHGLAPTSCRSVAVRIRRTKYWSQLCSIT